MKNIKLAILGSVASGLVGLSCVMLTGEALASSLANTTYNYTSGVIECTTVHGKTAKHPPFIVADPQKKTIKLLDMDVLIMNDIAVYSDGTKTFTYGIESLNSKQLTLVSLSFRSTPADPQHLNFFCHGNVIYKAL